MTKYFIPSNSVLGEYKITINAEKNFDKKTINDNLEDSFFVKYLKSGSTNHKPHAFVNLDQIIYHNFINGKFAELLLNGIGSYDPEKRKLSYNWTYLNPTNNTITLNDFDTILPKIKIKDVKQKDIFDFKLIVNDRIKNTLPKNTKITAFNDTLRIINGTLHNFESKDFDSNYEPLITILDYRINNNIGYNVHIIDDDLNYGKLNMTINKDGQKYDIVNADIIDGKYNQNYGFNVNAVNGW